MAVNSQSPSAGAAKTSLLLLEAPPADYTGDEVVCEMGGWDGSNKKSVDAAGRGFEEWWKARFGVEGDNDDEGDVDGQDEADYEGGDGSTEEREVGINPEWESKDHYKVLGLQHLRWRATQNDIRKAYRKLVLVLHPDKLANNPNAPKDIDAAFKRLQDANDFLSNKDKRVIYDSEDNFDDTIPSGEPADDADFFRTYGHLFTSNSRWSCKQPVPPLGKSEDNLSYVHMFYDFWSNFKSWREFSVDDPDLTTEGCESRFERRWVQRKIDKEKKKKKNDENLRIRKLVEQAMKFDPRLIREREEQARIKREQAEEKKRKEEAAKLEEQMRKEQEEADRIREEFEKKEREAEEKRQKAANKKLIQAQRQRLRKLSQARECEYQDVEVLCQALSIVELTDLNDRVEEETEGSASKVIPQAREALRKKQKEAEAAVSGKAKKLQSASSNESAKSEVWTEEEMTLLTKGLKKFPGGTKKRWETIGQWMGSRSGEEVLEKVKSLRDKDILGSKADFATSRSSKPQDKGSPATTKASAKAAETSSPKPAAAAPASGEAKDPALVAVQSWTQNEQVMLEAALKEYPASLPPAERWKSIAARVPGRSPKECVERYKYLVAQLKAKKAAAAASK